MELRVVKQQDWELVRNVVSMDYFRKKAVILGAFEEEKIIGVLIMEKGEIDYTISVLWVEQQHRQKHIATALVDMAIKYAMKNDVEELSITYEAKEKNAYILDYMFSKKKFRMELEDIPRYVITKEILQQSAFFMEMKEKTKKNSSIIPLAKLSVYQLKEMQDRFSQNGIHMVNRINLLEIDGKRSKVLLVDDVVKGMVLLKKKAKPDEMELVLFFVLQSHAALGIPLLLETSDILFDSSEIVKSVEFICINEKSEALTKKILGNVEPDYASMCHGILDLDRMKR